MSRENCQGCGEAISDTARAKGWPIEGGAENGGGPDTIFVGPCCADGYCDKGHVLPVEHEDCDECSGVWVDLDALEAAAKAATPGPWSASPDGVVYPEHDEEACVADCSHGGRSNARYVAAASPDVVLRLVAAVRESSERVSTAEVERAQAATWLAEARAEIAAYQGKPEGAINANWHYRGGWERLDRGVNLYVDQNETDFRWQVRPDLDNSDEAEKRTVYGNAESPRAAMRAAEAAANGWLS